MEKLSLVSYFLSVNKGHYNIYFISTVSLHENIFFITENAQIFLFIIDQFLPGLGYLSPKLQFNMVYSIVLVWEEMENIILFFL